MNYLGIEEEKIIEDKIIKNIGNLFKQEKAIKDRIIRDITNLLELENEGESYYKLIGVGIEYESNGNRNKTLSIEEYPNKIRPYLKDINKISEKLIHAKKIASN